MTLISVSSPHLRLEAFSLEGERDGWWLSEQFHTHPSDCFYRSLIVKVFDDPTSSWTVESLSFVLVRLDLGVKAMKVFDDPVFSFSWN